MPHDLCMLVSNRIQLVRFFYLFIFILYPCPSDSLSPPLLLFKPVWLFFFKVVAVKIRFSSSFNDFLWNTMLQGILLPQIPCNSCFISYGMCGSVFYLLFISKQCRSLVSTVVWVFVWARKSGQPGGLGLVELLF